MAVAVHVGALGRAVERRGLADDAVRRVVREHAVAVVQQYLRHVAAAAVRGAVRLLAGIVQHQIQITVLVEIAGFLVVRVRALFWRVFGRNIRGRGAGEARAVGEIGVAVVQEDTAVAFAMVDQDIEVEIAIDIDEVEIRGARAVVRRGGRRRNRGREVIGRGRARRILLRFEQRELAGAVVDVEEQARHGVDRAVAPVGHDEIQITIAVEVAEVRRRGVRHLPHGQVGGGFIREHRRRRLDPELVEIGAVGAGLEDVHVAVAVDVTDRDLATLSMSAGETLRGGVEERAVTVVHIHHGLFRVPRTEQASPVGHDDVEITVFVDVRELEPVGVAAQIAAVGAGRLWRAERDEGGVAEQRGGASAAGRGEDRNQAQGHQASCTTDRSRLLDHDREFPE